MPILSSNIKISPKAKAAIDAAIDGAVTKSKPAMDRVVKAAADAVISLKRDLNAVADKALKQSLKDLK